MNKQFLLALAMVIGLKHKQADDTEIAFTEETISEEMCNKCGIAVQYRTG
jgi:hypothetical protein